MIDIYHHISRYLTFNNLTRLNDHYTQPVALLVAGKKKYTKKVAVYAGKCDRKESHHLPNIEQLTVNKLTLR